MITVIVLAVVFIAGAATGIGVILRLGIRREESDYSLYRKPPTRSAAVTRRILGWHTDVPHQNRGAKQANSVRRPRPAAVTPSL